MDTHLLPPRHIQGNESWEDPALCQQLTGHVGGKLLIVAYVQVLRFDHKQVFSH